MQSTKQSSIIDGKIPFATNIIYIYKRSYLFMKKNVRPIIAILLIIFSVSSSLGSYFINSMNNGYVSIYSDELLNKNNIN